MYAGTDSYQRILAEAAVEAGEVPQGTQGNPQLNLAVSTCCISHLMYMHRMTSVTEQPYSGVGLHSYTALSSRYLLSY